MRPNKLSKRAKRLGGLGQQYKTPLIIICGCYVRQGKQILENLATFLQEHGVNAYTVSQIFPLPEDAPPEERRRSSCEAFKRADAVLFVVLSNSTLGVGLNADITGGWAFEAGVLYAMDKQGRRIRRAFLYDGEEMLRRVSKMVRGLGSGWGYEAYTEQGDYEQLRALALHLCLRLIEACSMPSENL